MNGAAGGQDAISIERCLFTLLEAPETYTEPGKAQHLNRELSTTVDRLQTATTEWEQAASQLAELEVVPAKWTGSATARPSASASTCTTKLSRFRAPSSTWRPSSMAPSSEAAAQRPQYKQRARSIA